MHIPKQPRKTVTLALEKQAGFNPIKPIMAAGKSVMKGIGHTGRGLKRTGGNLIDYGKQLVTNPVKTLKNNALNAGATVRDKEKQFDILENALEGAVRKGHKVNFSVMNKADPNAGFFSRAVQKLRGEGIATAGRRNLGNISQEAQEKLIKEMDAKNLLHRSKDGTISIHRDANVDDLRAVYDNLQNIDTVSGPGVIGKIRNATNYVPLPGERGMLGLGIAGSAVPQLMNKETKDGRQRSLAERIGRAGVMTAAELAVAPIGVANRLYGGLGMGAEIGTTMGTELLLNRNNKNTALSINNQFDPNINPAMKNKPAMNIPGAPGSMQKQAGMMTNYFDNLLGKTVKAKKAKVQELQDTLAGTQDSLVRVGDKAREAYKRQNNLYQTNLEDVMSGRNTDHDYVRKHYIPNIESGPEMTQNTLDAMISSNKYTGDLLRDALKEQSSAIADMNKARAYTAGAGAVPLVAGAYYAGSKRNGEKTASIPKKPRSVLRRVIK